MSAVASSRWKSRPLCPGSLTSSTRQLGPSGGSDLRKSETDANSSAFRPTDRNRRPSELRSSASSSMTRTVEFASSIVAAQSSLSEPLHSQWLANLNPRTELACFQYSPAERHRQRFTRGEIPSHHCNDDSLGRRANL